MASGWCCRTGTAAGWGTSKIRTKLSSSTASIGTPASSTSAGVARTPAGSFARLTSFARLETRLLQAGTVFARNSIPHSREFFRANGFCRRVAELRALAHSARPPATPEDVMKMH